MDVLQLHRVSVYPPTNGGERRVWETAKKLSEHGTVWLGCPWPAETVLPDDVQPFKLSTKLLSWKKLRIQTWNATMAIGSHNVYTKYLTQRILKTVDSNSEFDLICCESPQVFDACLRIANKLNIPLLLNKHNAAYTLLEECLESSKVPDPIKTRAVRNLQSLEERSINLADIVVFQSDKDKDNFTIPDDVSVKVIPNGCDFERLQKGDGTRFAERYGRRERPTCVFVGSYDYAPNLEAARIISNELALAIPDAEFLLVGRNPPEQKPSNVRAIGFVDELPDALAYADVAICPLKRGSGTKLKMMDYLAAGLPVVTTSVGAQGIDIEPKRHALIADDIDNFVEATRRAIESPDLQQTLSANARELGYHYRWERVLSDYDDVMEDIKLSIDPEGKR